MCQPPNSHYLNGDLCKVSCRDGNRKPINYQRGVQVYWVHYRTNVQLIEPWLKPFNEPVFLYALKGGSLRRVLKSVSLLLALHVRESGWGKQAHVIFLRLFKVPNRRSRAPEQLLPAACLQLPGVGQDGKPGQHNRRRKQ